MKLTLAYILLVLVVFTSCKSVKKITNSPDSGIAFERKKSRKTKTFIEGIEVTPGSVVKSKHKPATTKQQDSVEAATPSKKITYNGSELQNKYAEKLGIEPSSLPNETLLAKIDEWWAVRYCLGGSSKNCVDCSSLMQTFYGEVFNVTIPRTAAEQYNNSLRIEREELQLGDMVFFITYGKSVTHVGMYLGNNKFVHASTSQGVMISDLMNDSYWKTRYYGSGRVLK